MSEHPPADTPEGPDLDPATEADVRRLLAEARHTGPLPPEVAGRLDTLLGELVQTRTAATGVHSLEARRHRRRRLLLVAAAAAVVFGVAVPTVNQVRDLGSSGDDSASSADTAGSAASDSNLDSDSGESMEQAAPTTGDVGGPVVLTAASFEAVVRQQAYSRSLDAAPSGAPAPAAPAPPPAAAQSTSGCDLAAGDYGDGQLLPATYDGTPAVLAYRPARDGEQRVDLLSCGDATVIRTTTIPAS